MQYGNNDVKLLGGLTLKRTHFNFLIIYVSSPLLTTAVDFDENIYVLFMLFAIVVYCLLVTSYINLYDTCVY